MDEQTRNGKQFRTCETNFTIRENEDGKKHIRGYFAVFNSNYEICPGATESIDRHAFDGQLNADVRMLVNHDPMYVIGRTTAGTMTLGVDEHGLYADAIVNENDSDAMNCWARVERGDVNQASFGFNITEEQTEWREDGSCHWTIKGVELFEVSVCTFPAYRATEVSARAEEYKAASKKREFDIWKASALAKLKKDVI